MGGGPAGLYFALLMKLHDPGHDITVFDRSAVGSAHGWGVTFGGDLMMKFYENDARSAREIDQAAFRWINQVVDVHGRQAQHAGGDGYSIQRQRLLGILADRARSLGVRMELGREVESSSQLPDADLIVACDGVNSRLRHESGKFQPDVRLSGNKYIWLGTDKVFESFLYSFVRTDSGWIWAYTYPVDIESSTFIVECLPGTWTGLGFDAMPLRDSLILLEKLFDRHLDSHHLIRHSGDGVGARWLNFRTVTNQSWHHGKVVLAGDAAHTSHYSIGWGTKLAIEDVIALADSLRCHASLPTALESYERQRQAALVRPASDARFSAQWFENIGRYIDLKPEQFSMLLHGRRSPLLAHIPPKIYCQLLGATEDITVLQQLRKRVAPWAKAVYGRRMLTQSDKFLAASYRLQADSKIELMQILLMDPGALGPPEIAAWQSMQQATPSLANPFLSSEFALAVSRYRPGTQVAVLTEGQSIAGFFPFERRRLGVGVPIGGWLSPCQGLIHAPGVDWDPRELLRGCRLSAWQFDNLIIDQQPFGPYHTATDPVPVMDLTDGFDAYYAKLRFRSSRFCREIARKTRKLGREADGLRIEADSGDSSVLRTLIDWKSDQYRRTSHVDRFEQPWLAGLLETLLATRAEHFGGLLSVLYAGNQPVAAQFGLRTRNSLVGWFTGYDVRFAKYSPGIIHLMQMAEQLAAAGIDHIYMGKGARRYTETLKSHDVFVADGVVTGQTLLGAAHRVRTATSRWAVRTIRGHPGAHDAADWILRRSGASRRTYGRI